MAMRYYEVVGSQQLDRIAYNPESKELRAVFVSGGEYSYQGVPAIVVVGLMFDQQSVGSAFDRLIKKGGYAYQKVETIKNGLIEPEDQPEHDRMKGEGCPN